MRILVVHNRYQIRGGEDTCVEQESSMLEKAGNAVSLLEVSNDHIIGFRQQIYTALGTVYSASSRSLVSSRIQSFKPDVVHVHNFFPILSPAIFDASSRIPFIQTLHNYRTVCASAYLFRDGRVCEECLGKRVPWPAIRHSCYRGSRAGSAVLATMIAVHQARNTWRNQVSRFIALTDFARDVFMRNLKLRDEQIVVKPNASEDLGRGDGTGNYALFVGRLSNEKGVTTLLKAAEIGLRFKLIVAGEGPLSSEVIAASNNGLCEYVGKQSRESISILMRNARVLLLPSLWYEGLPMVIPEAYACGLPIIASNLGSLSSLIVNGETGTLVEPGSPTALAEATNDLASHPQKEANMRARARECYEAFYRPEENVKQLLTVYESSIKEKLKGREERLRMGREKT